MYNWFVCFRLLHMNLDVNKAKFTDCRRDQILSHIKWTSCTKCMLLAWCMWYYYTSREDTLILLDKSHMSKVLATCVSEGSLTAVTIRRNDTRCQGNVNDKASSGDTIMLATPKRCCICLLAAICIIDYHVSVIYAHKWCPQTSTSC